MFVAYPYSFPAADYRPVFEAVGATFDVTFTFADERITNVHILQKIDVMMSEAAFSLFDVTSWNPNVALELGLAYGRGLDFYILFNPTADREEVLADLRGIDRIEYTSYADLRERLSRLVEDQFGSPQQQAGAEGLKAELEGVRQQIPEVVKQNPGILMGGIASAIGLPVDMTQTLVRPMVGEVLETRGIRRGMQYYIHGDAPPETDDVGGADTAATTPEEIADSEGG